MKGRGPRSVLVVAMVLATSVFTLAPGAAGAAESQPLTTQAPAVTCDTKPVVRWEGHAELRITPCPTSLGPLRYEVSWPWGDRAWENDLPAGNRFDIDDFGLPYAGQALTVSARNEQDQRVGVGTTVGSYRPFSSEAQMRDRLGRDLLGRPATARDLAGVASNPSSVAAHLIRGPYWQVQSPVVRLYRAAFLRLPDTAGLDYWVAQRRGGRSLTGVAAYFAASPELVERYGALTDREFVEQVYQNVLGRPGEPDGIDYWTAQLTSRRKSRGDVLLGFSESAEHRSRTLTLVQAVNIVTGLLRRVPTADEVAAPLSVAQRIDEILWSPAYSARLGGVPPLPLPQGDGRLPIVGDVGYGAQMSALFATGAVTYSVGAGSTLPPGLTLTSSGLLSGDPALGTWRFRIAAADGTGETGTNELTMTVRPTRTGVDLVAGQCLLDLDGDVLCSGTNAGGELGDGTTTGRSTYAPALGVAPATDLASGGGRSCTVSDGTVRCWGPRRVAGQVQPGPTPTAVPGITTATQVAVGFDTGCALLTGGAVQCWPDAAPDPRTPAAVALPGPAAQVEVAPTSPIYQPSDRGHACALLVDGRVWCWGANAVNQLGIGAGEPSATPVAVPGVADAVEITVNAMGGCARLEGGAVWCWGDSNNDDDDDDADGAGPSAVDVVAEATDLGGGDVSTCALLAGGTVTCWGLIDYQAGMSGGGAYTYAENPIPALSGVAALDGLGASLAGDRIRTIQPLKTSVGGDVTQPATAGWVFA